MHNDTQLSRKIVRAGIAVAIGHLLFKLAGLIQVAVMGRVLPKDVYDATYGFAFENCVFMLFLVGQEIIGPTLMPLFMRELNSEEGERSAWSLVQAVFRFQGLILLLVMAALMIFPGWFVERLTMWSPTERPEIFEMARSSLASLAPALLGLSFATTTYVILNAYKRFFLAALADAVWKFAVVIGLLAGLALAPQQIRWYLTASLLVGSLLKFATHLAGLRDKAALLRLRPNLRHPALRDLGRLMLPLIVGILFAKWRDIFNNTYILSGLEEAGLIQANSMGRKLNGTISLLIPYTLAIAMFPFLCELVDRDDRQALGDLLTRSGRMLVSILLPFSCVVAVIAPPLTALLFGGGHFDETAVARTSISMACYTFALPAIAVEMLMMQAFFANRRTLSVALTGIIFSAVSIAISYYAIVVLKWQGGRALAAVAGGLTLSRWLKTGTLALLLRRSAPLFPLWPTAAFLLRALLMSLTATAAAWLGIHLLDRLSVPLHGLIPLVTRLAVAGIAAATGFVAGCFVFGVKEPREMLRWTIARAKGRQPLT